MSCAPCTTCEDCRTLTHVWPGCGTSDVENLNPYSGGANYVFVIDIPIYLDNGDDTMSLVPVNTVVNVRWAKKNGAIKQTRHLISDAGILTLDGAEDWYSDGFFNADAGLIQMDVETDAGVPALIISNPDGAMAAYQCADCILISFTTGSLPLSTVPFEFDCDFVQCDLEVSVPCAVCNDVGYYGNDSANRVYLCGYVEQDLIDDPSLLPIQAYFNDACTPETCIPDLTTAHMTQNDWVMTDCMIIEIA